MDVFCLLLLIRILYQMYINRVQNYHWNYFYYTIAWACVYLFMDAIWIMNVKHFLTFSKIQSGIFNSFYFCSLAMLVCSWYVYVQKTLHSAVLKHKKILVLTFIPLIFFIGSSLLSYCENIGEMIQFNQRIWENNKRKEWLYGKSCSNCRW